MNLRSVLCVVLAVTGMMLSPLSSDAKTVFLPEVELAFYRYNSSDCLVVLNGEPTVSVSRQDVVELVEAVNGEVLD